MNTRGAGTARPHLFPRSRPRATESPAGLPRLTLRRARSWTISGVRSATNRLGIDRLPCHCAGSWTSIPTHYWYGLSFRYEPAVYQTLKAELKRGDTFFDVGAHFGIWSRVAHQIVGPEGSVVAFEPSPAYSRLEGYMGKTQARLENVAIGSELGEAVFFAQGAATTGSLSREVTAINEEFEDGEVSELRVPIQRLDDYCEEIGITPSLIKIDVEGFELEALRGAQNLLEKRRPKLVIEVHPPQLELSGGSEAALFEHLESAGYSSQVIDQNENSLFTILCLPDAFSA